MSDKLPVSDWSDSPDACYASQRYPYVFPEGPVRNYYYHTRFVKFERRVDPSGKNWRLYVERLEFA